MSYGVVGDRLGADGPADAELDELDSGGHLPLAAGED